jgi:YfiH family protein
MTMAADCAPILLYDKVKKVIAALHSGRVGTKKEIAKNAINLFLKEFDSNSKDIVVAVGPSIGVCCYEVGRDIADESDKRYIKTKAKGYYLDIKSMLKDQFLNMGLKEENIKISGECTCCNKDYFSYRRDGKCGRFCGIIMLK